jgi:uncharacterized membrane protein
MSNPIVLAVFALVGGGFLRFCMQIAGMNKVHAPSFLMVAYLVPTLLFAIYLVGGGRHFELSPKMTANAVVIGLLTGGTMWAIVSAFLRGGEGTVVFPIASLGLIVPVLLSLIFFKDSLTAQKVIGLLLGIGSIVVLSR